MKVSVEKKELMKVVKMAAEALPGEKTNLQITKCFVIKAEGNFLFVRAMSMEEGIGIQSGIVCKAKETGEICVDGAMFQNLISKAPEGELTIYTEEKSKQLIVKKDKSKMRISYRDVDQFPDDMTKPDGVAVKIDRKKFFAAIEGVLFAVSDDSAQKKELTALHILLRNSVMRVEGLDGYRVAVNDIKVPQAEDSELDLLIPKSTARKLLKFLSEKNSDKESDSCNLYCNESILAVTTGSSILTARLLAGTYFDLEKITPQEHKTIVTVNKTELLDSLNRSLLYCCLTGDRDKPISFIVKDGCLTITADSAVGEMKDELSATTDGEEMTLHYNPRYLMDALKAIPDEDVTFYINGPKVPCVIRGDGFEYMVLGVAVAAKEKAA